SARWKESARPARSQLRGRLVAARQAHSTFPSPFLGPDSPNPALPVNQAACRPACAKGFPFDSERKVSLGTIKMAVKARPGSKDVSPIAHSGHPFVFRTSSPLLEVFRRSSSETPWNAVSPAV